MLFNISEQKINEMISKVTNQVYIYLNNQSLLREDTDILLWEDDDEEQKEVLKEMIENASLCIIRAVYIEQKILGG